MFATEVDKSAAYRVLIRPNRSLSWTQAKRFFALMCAVCLSVAGFFAVQGYWPILPFAGLELTALAICLWLVAQRQEIREVVYIGAERVSVSKGRRSVTEVWDSHPAWARLTLKTSRSSWYPSQLVLRSHGREVAIGDFLTEEERRRLAAELDAALSAQRRRLPAE